MSGGYFDRNIYAIGEIVASIERDIARALRPKPEKIHKDYWTIYVKDSFGSYHSYMGFLSFSSYEEAESFLLYKPQNKMFHFCKTFCSKITLVNTIQNVILNPI